MARGEIIEIILPYPRKNAQMIAKNATNYYLCARKNKNEMSLKKTSTTDGETSLLQLLACVLEPMTYTNIGEMYRYIVSGASIAKISFRDLADKKLIRTTKDSYIAYHQIEPENWVNILKTIDNKQFLLIKKAISKNRRSAADTLFGFVGAVIDFLNGHSFQNNLILFAAPTFYPIKSEVLNVFIDRLLYVENSGNFLAALPEKTLIEFFFDYWAPQYYFAQKPSASIDVLYKTFFSNPRLNEKTRELIYHAYLYGIDFYQTGEIDRVLGLMKPDSEFHQKLSAVKCLHNGDVEGALTLLTTVLKANKAQFFTETFTNFVYALALGQSKNPKARTTAIKLLNNRKAFFTTGSIPMFLVLNHYTQDKAKEYYEANKTHKQIFVGQALCAFFLHHHHIYDDNTIVAKDAVQAVKASTSAYIRLLYAFDFDQFKPLLQLYKEHTGITTPLMPEVKYTEPWERTISHIIAINAATAPPKKKTDEGKALEVSKVAYCVNKNFEVTPRLLKSKDGGITWSKGRNIALKTFLENIDADYMTDTDHKIGTLILKEPCGWYGSMNYTINHFAAVAALVGSPNVLSDGKQQKIDVIEEPLQITASPTPTGYSIKTNVDTIDQIIIGNNLEWKGDRQISVIKINNVQYDTILMLAKIANVPQKGKEPLTRLLEAVSNNFTVMSPLLKNTVAIKHVDSSALIAVQIAPLTSKYYDDNGTPLGNMYSISLAVKPFGTQPPYQKPAVGVEIVSATINGEKLQTERDLKAERKNLDTVCKVIDHICENQYDDLQWELNTRECLQLLDALRTMPDTAFVEWPQGVKMKVLRPMVNADKLVLKISSAGQWFELEGELKIGDKEKLKIAQLLERLRTAEGNFIRLEGDEYIAISEQLRKQLQAIDQMTVGKGNDIKIAAINGLQLSAFEQIGANIKADENFKSLITRIRESVKKEFAVPANIRAELRPYQKDGFQWMSRLASWGAGACLADDMGLGKTLQAITLMQSRAALGPQLVVMPTNVLMNWQQELNRFAPALTVKNLNQGDRRQIIESAEPGDVIICTYGLLVTEIEPLTSRTWTTIVLDEAHAIKNRDTQTSKGAMQLNADFRLMLTGTPLQNHLSEIWNLFQFANPGLLGSFQQFTDRFILPVERDHDTDRRRILKNLLTPFMLRRTKEDVLNELPEKTEITLRIELSDDEQALYDNLRQQAIANLEEGQRNPIQALAEITKLRQAACNPRLVNPKLKLKSSKMEAFINLVQQLRNGGHRALVFSQFTSHLALVREALDAENITYLYLDGSTPAQERNKLVKQFQTEDQTLFLISLKAGGIGLNLTAADYVIHLDPWWNPAIEDQASDRAYRIGQERPVTVYRIIAANTIEEKIIRLHQNKRSLADALLQDADLFCNISADEIIKLLREGVEAIK